MPSGQTAYVTPVFSPSDPVVCTVIQLRPALRAVLFNELQRLGYEWSWRQDDPAAATVEEVITEINNATDLAVFWGCMKLGSIYHIATDPADFELVCDGSTYDRVDYPDLYAVLRAEYIIDADTFRVPSLIDRVVRGSLTPGAAGGSDSITPTVAQLPPHHHTYDKTIAAASVVLGELPGFELGAYFGTDTSDTGSGDPITIIPAHETAIPVILAALPTAG